MNAGLRAVLLRFRIPLLLLVAGFTFLSIDHRLGVAEREREAVRIALAHTNGNLMEVGAMFRTAPYESDSAKREQLESMVADHGVLWAAVTDSTGRIVLAAPRTLEGRRLRDVAGVDPDAPAPIERRREGLHSKYLGHARAFGIGPMGSRPMPDGMRFAILQDITPRLKNAESDTFEQTRPAALALLLIIAIVALLLERWLHVPARRIAEVSERIAAGDRSARTGLEGDHDLALAGRAFDRMAEQVERTECELREARNVIDAALESMPVGFAVIDRDSMLVLRANARWSENFGGTLPHGTPLEQGFRKLRFVRPDGTVYPFEQMATPRVIASGRPVVVNDIALELTDGRRIPFLVHAQPVSFGSGRDFDAVVVISQDRGELATLAEELRVWERRFVQVASLTGQIIFEMDLVTGRVVRSGDAMRLFGYESGDAWQPSFQEWLARLHPDERESVENEFRACLASGRPFDREYRFRHADGRYRVLHDRAFFELDATGRPARMYGTLVDVTRQRELEEQLRQAQKMETVGTLAGGIAHDFNNQLTGIIGHLELLALGLDGDDPRRQNAQVARLAAERCAELTRGLLAFSRRLTSHPQPTRLAPLLEESLLLLRRLLPASMQLEHTFEPGLPPVLVDPVQIQQVLFNLCVNARDAMRENGRLSVRARLADAAALTRRPAEATSERFVELAVADDGTGMSDDVRARIFEPFFTTKPVGQGTGLGLAMVYGIVSKHGGWVEVDTRLDEGSCFRVYLPVAETAEPAGGGAAANAPRSNEGELVLVVDDETVVRDLAAYLLEEAGYRVLRASDGRAAMQLVDAHRERVRVVVLDLVMPGMSGHELLERLRIMVPETRVILSTGYAPDSASLPPGAFGLLQKPYDRAGLLAAVRAALAAEAPAAR